MQRRVSPTVLVLLALGACQGLLIGCEKSEIHSYRAPREFRGTPETSGVANPSQQEEIHVEWDAPAGWTEVETTSSMRIATFQAPNGLEVAITSFPGDVGGLLANVNRWRNQVGVDPITEEEVEQAIERQADSGVIVVDVAGESSRLLGAIINVGDGQTWFLKTTGPTEDIAPLKDDLISFAKSFKVHDHASHSSGASPSTADTQNTPPQWTPPGEWKVEKDHSSMLLAAFQSDSGGRITISQLAGDGGGVLANVNRWRNQLGLPIANSVDELGIESIGKGSSMTDLVSPDGESRMMAAMVPIGAQTLFFKLTGSPQAVDAELERFRACVEQVGLAIEVLP
ncbi:MAG: hypothetical protein ACWA5W_08290 [Phycisphaerales bacterium]